MKKLILNLLKYILLMLCCLLALLLICPSQFSKDYTASIADKLQRLESIQEPKIILVGESNLAFGIDSAMLEEAFQMPVVNLGLHGGLGYQFHYNMAKRNIGPGDIVILANLSFGDGLIQDGSLAWITIENGDDLWTLIPKENIPDMLVTFPSYVVDTVEATLQNRLETVSGTYSREAFNSWGDIAVYRESGQLSFADYTITVPEVTEKGLARVNEFAAFCEAQGAVCLMSGYPIAFGEYSPSAGEYRQSQQELEGLLEFEMISDYTDYFFDYSLFYDSQYHLSTEGAQLRTQQLIQDLHQWQQGQTS